MKIDLFTFIAQILNFFVLVWLLYVFLYKKILIAIDKKSQAIKNEYEQAKGAKQQAEEKHTHFTLRLNQLEDEKEAILTGAKEEAKKTKEALLQEAHEELDKKRSKWEQRLNTEKEAFLTRLSSEMGHEVYATAAHVIKELSGTELSQHIFHQFILHLESLDEETKEKIRSLYQKKKEKPKVLSTWELSVENQKAIAGALSKILNVTPEISFHFHSEEGFGIRLLIDSYRINWTADDHLKRLTEHFDKMLERTNGT